MGEVACMDKVNGDEKGVYNKMKPSWWPASRRGKRGGGRGRPQNGKPSPDSFPSHLSKTLA